MRGFLITALMSAGLAAASTGSAQGAASGIPSPGEGSQSEHVLILLDASGSMTARMEGPDPGRMVTRMEAAKQAISKVVDGLGGDVRIGLLVFSSLDGREWAYAIGPLDKGRFRAGLMAIEADGGTPLGEFIEKAANALLAKRQELKGYGEYRLVVVTDGEAEDPERMGAAATQLLSRGISLDVVGVQMAEAHALSTTAHSYREAGDMASLEKAISALLAETGGAGWAQGDAEAYALANAFSDSAAGAVVKSLALGLSNEPIGTAGAGPEAAGAGPEAAGAGPEAAGAAAAAAAARGGASAPEANAGKTGWWAVAIVVLAVWWIRKVFRRALR